MAFLTVYRSFLVHPALALAYTKFASNERLSELLGRHGEPVKTTMPERSGGFFLGADPYFKTFFTYLEGTGSLS